MSSLNPFSLAGPALPFIPENSFEIKTAQSNEWKVSITKPIHCPTAGGGHCAIHSVFGVKTKGKYFCNDFLKKRWELRDRIIDLCEGKNGQSDKCKKMRSLVIESLQSSIAGCTIGSTSESGKLFINYRIFESKNEQLKNKQLQNLGGLLEEYRDIKNFIFTTGSGATSFQAMLTTTLNKDRPGFIRLLQSTSESCQQAFTEWQKPMAKFDWDTHLTPKLIQEYANQFIQSDPVKWLSAYELYMISVAFDINIIYYFQNFDNEPTYFRSVTQTTNTVVIWTNGINHYERVEYERLHIIAPKQNEKKVEETRQQLIPEIRLKKGLETSESLGHDVYARSMAVLKDGRVIRAGTRGKLKIWNPSNEEEVSINIFFYDIFALTVVGDFLAVTNSSEKSIQLWDFSDINCPKIIASLSGHSEFIYYLLFLSSNKLLSIGDDRTIRLWDVRKQKSTKIIEEKSSLVGPTIRAVVPISNNRLASTYRNTIKLWDPEDIQSSVLELKGHKGLVTALIILPNGNLVSGSEDKTIKIWDLHTNTCLKTLEGHEGEISSMVVLANGNLVSCSSIDKSIRLWDVAKAKPLQIIQDTNASKLVILPDGRLISCTDEGILHSWYCLSLAIQEQTPLISIKEYFSSLTSLRECLTYQLSKDTRLFAFHGQFVDVPKLEQKPAKVYSKLIDTYSMSILKDGRLILGQSFYNIKILNPSTEKTLSIIDGDENTKNYGIYSLAVSKNFLIVGCCVLGAQNCPIYVYDMSAQKPKKIATLIGHTQSVYHLLALQSDQLLSISADLTLRIWNITNGECLRVIGRGLWDELYYIKSIVSMPSGKLASTCKNEIYLWEPTDEKFDIQVLSGHKDSVNTLVSLNNGHLVSGSTDKTIKIWELHTNTCIQTLNGHTGAVNSIVALTNEVIISCSSEDNTIRLWHILKNQPLQTIVSSYPLKLEISNEMLVSANMKKILSCWSINKPQVKDLKLNLYFRSKFLEKNLDAVTFDEKSILVRTKVDSESDLITFKNFLNIVFQDLSAEELKISLLNPRQMQISVLSNYHRTEMDALIKVFFNINQPQRDVSSELKSLLVPYKLHEASLSKEQIQLFQYFKNIHPALCSTYLALVISRIKIEKLPESDQNCITTLVQLRASLLIRVVIDLKYPTLSKQFVSLIDDICSASIRKINIINSIYFANPLDFIIILKSTETTLQFIPTAISLTKPIIRSDDSLFPFVLSNPQIFIDIINFLGSDFLMTQAFGNESDEVILQLGDIINQNPEYNKILFKEIYPLLIQILKTPTHDSINRLELAHVCYQVNRYTPEPLDDKQILKIKSNIDFPYNLKNSLEFLRQYPLKMKRMFILDHLKDCSSLILKLQMFSRIELYIEKAIIIANQEYQSGLITIGMNNKKENIVREAKKLQQKLLTDKNEIKSYEEAIIMLKEQLNAPRYSIFPAHEKRGDQLQKEVESELHFS